MHTFVFSQKSIHQLKGKKKEHCFKKEKQTFFLLLYAEIAHFPTAFTDTDAYSQHAKHYST